MPFISTKGRLLDNLESSGFIPVQYDPNDQEVLLLAAMGDNVAKSTGVSFLLMIFFQLFLGGSLKMIWNLLNMMQIISFLPLLNLQQPAAFSVFFEKVNLILIKIPIVS